jgi:ribose-phosphate pyrophosphokinase
MLIISGSSNVGLSEGISNRLFTKPIDCNLYKFNCGETGIQINETVRGNDIVIIQSGYNRNIQVNDIVMETGLLIDACRRSSAKSITLIIPCYPYARQDRKDSSRSPISAAFIANMFEMAGLTRIVCMDLHSPQIQGFFRIPVDNLYSINLVHKKLIELYDIDKDEEREKYYLISPDAGAVKRTLKFANVMNIKMCLMHKERDYSKPGTVSKNILICEDASYFSGKTAIVTDDMIDSGGTFIKACNTLIEKGFENVIGVITHGYFTKDALKKINDAESIKKIIVSNSICQKENLEECPKLDLLDVSSQLAEAIRIICDGGSMSNLF